jgi:hypothetical protein
MFEELPLFSAIDSVTSFIDAIAITPQAIAN